MYREELTKLWDILDQFRKTERNVFAVWLERKENDSEHSYELCLMCWFLGIQYNNNWGSLDINKVIQYALIHDLVEVYAWDTDTYSWPKDLSDSKHEREMISLEKLSRDLWFFPEVIKTIEGYESQGDEESQFVKWIDKSLFPLAQLRDNFRSRKKLHKNISLAEVDVEKQKKTKHPFAKNLWNSIRDYLTLQLWRDSTKKFWEYV